MEVLRRDTEQNVVKSHFTVNAAAAGTKFKTFEQYLKDGVLAHYAEFNEDTGKWEITFDELVEMGQFYLDKYWEQEINKAVRK